MKYAQRIFATLIASLLVTHVAHAISICPNMNVKSGLPQTCIFDSQESSNNTLTFPFIFPNTQKKIRFLCYFTPDNKEKLTGLTVKLHSEDVTITLNDASKPKLIAGHNDALMFTAVSPEHSTSQGHILFNLEGGKEKNLEGLNISITCIANIESK